MIVVSIAFTFWFRSTLLSSPPRRWCVHLLHDVAPAHELAAVIHSLPPMLCFHSILILLFGSEHLVELPGGVHLLHDVAPAHELAVDEHLRDGRPRGELLDAVAQFLPKRVNKKHLYGDESLTQQPGVW